VEARMNLQALAETRALQAADQACLDALLDGLAE
jgi:hypothetical protein